MHGADEALGHGVEPVPERLGHRGFDDPAGVVGDEEDEHVAPGAGAEGLGRVRRVEEQAADLVRVLEPGPVEAREATQCSVNP